MFSLYAKKLLTAKTLLPAAVAVLAFAIMGYAVYLWAVDDGHVQSSARDQTGDPPAFMVPPAASLDELTSRAEIVVVGKVTGIVSTDRIVPGGENVEIVPIDADATELFAAGLNPGLPFTHFTFEVNEYVKGSGTDSVILTQYGDLREPPGSLLLPKTGIRGRNAPISS